ATSRAPASRPPRPRRDSYPAIRLYRPTIPRGSGHGRWSLLDFLLERRGILAGAPRRTIMDMTVQSQPRLPEHMVREILGYRLFLLAGLAAGRGLVCRWSVQPGGRLACRWEPYFPVD